MIMPPLAQWTTYLGSIVVDDWAAAWLGGTCFGVRLAALLSPLFFTTHTIILQYLYIRMVRWGHVKNLTSHLPKYCVYYKVRIADS
jgi:hypothetical protein